jgi:hypothetical protein
MEREAGRRIGKNLVGLTPFPSMIGMAWRDVGRAGDRTSRHPGSRDTGQSFHSCCQVSSRRLTVESGARCCRDRYLILVSSGALGTEARGGSP